MAEIHTLIIWDKAKNHKIEVERRLQEKFQVIKILEFRWEKEFFLDNLFPFYAHSQKHRDGEDYKNILLGKIEHCGDGPFLLYVFRDNSPKYDFRQTSSGERKVNINIFDIKSSFRAITGGGHKIHASDNAFESNKDLTVLLGKNTDDFLQSLGDYSSQQVITNNCVGVGGFTDIRELFYLLNNSIEYIVLRNFEGLPDDYTLEGHGDIDLLLENCNYAVYLTGATAVYPEQPNRVHFHIKINGEEIPFDFRYYGDNYYDRKWQDRLLMEKVWFNGIIAIPNTENYFYSLLYHAYVQKYEIKDDYFPKLEALAREAGVDYNAKLSKVEVKNILDCFFDKKQYHYVIPKDQSVIFNTTFTVLGQKPNQYGKLISSQISRFDHFVLLSEVYYSSKNRTIFKVCSNAIAENEMNGLKTLEKSGFVPKVLNVIKKEEIFIIEMEFLQGYNLSDLYKDGTFWCKKNVKELIKNCIKILGILVEANIMHRDIKPDNLLIIKNKNEYVLKIIDFGWAINKSQENPLTPCFLGAPFNYGEGKFNDAYSMGKTLKEVFFRFPSITKLLDETVLNSGNDCFSQKELLRIEEKIDNLQFSKMEKLLFWVKKFPHVIAFTKKINYKLRNH